MMYCNVMYVSQITYQVYCTMCYAGILTWGDMQLRSGVWVCWLLHVHLTAITHLPKHSDTGWQIWA